GGRGVALVEGGMALREGGIDAPVLVLTEFPPGSDADALAAALTPTVYSEDGIRRLATAAAAMGVGAVAVHVKVDTGMHRVGARPEDLAGLCRRGVRSGLGLDGIWTQRPVPEDLDDPFTTMHLAR